MVSMMTGLYCTDECRDVSAEDLTLDQIEQLRQALHALFIQFLPLWDLAPISTRLKNALLRSHKTTLSDIADVHPESWATMPWMGVATYRELRQMVRLYGIALPERGRVRV